MKKKTIPVDAKGSGELIDSQTIWNENIRSYEFRNCKRTFWFRKETGLLVDDCNNNMVWPGQFLFDWIEKNNGISWYLSASSTYILVEIT
uniref:hypothetical protein n=1 Tax=Umezakia ovalisporum TaxID=75695 RepID=UPI0039C753BE